MNALQDEIVRLSAHLGHFDEYICTFRHLMANNTGRGPLNADQAVEYLQGVIDERQTWERALSARVLQLQGLRVRGEIKTSLVGVRDRRLPSSSANNTDRRVGLLLGQQQ